MMKLMLLVEYNFKWSLYHFFSLKIHSKIQNVTKYLSNHQHLANMLLEVLIVCVQKEA